MRVVLSTFACGGIEAFSGRDLAAGVRAALRHYTQDGGSAGLRASALLPLPDELEAGRSGVDLDLNLDPEVQAALEREARETDGVSVEQLATHAVLVYLADLDRYRASERDTRPLMWV
jgi:hypothetical protein